MLVVPTYPAKESERFS